MMKQLQQESQGAHPMDNAIVELTKELGNLRLLVGNLHNDLKSEMAKNPNPQVKAQLAEIRELLQEHLPERETYYLYGAALLSLWNAGRTFLIRIDNYKRLMDKYREKEEEYRKKEEERNALQAEKEKATDADVKQLDKEIDALTKTLQDIRKRIKAAEKNIKDAAKAFEEAITKIKETIGKLKTGATTLKQDLQSRQSSAQQQEIATVIQRAISTIDNISNGITSIEQKLSGLETIFAQTQDEVQQLLGRGGQETASPETSSKERADESTPHPSEEEPSNQASKLEKEVMGLYDAIEALEEVVNTAIENAGIIPKQFVGLNTSSVARGLISIDYKSLNDNLTFLEEYTGLERPDLLVELGWVGKENVTQPYFLKQQEAPSYDMPEGIKRYLEKFKAFLVEVRNRIRGNLSNILEEVSKLGNNLSQISDIEAKSKAQKVYSIPTFIILGACASKLNDNMPQSLIETIAPILGTILVAQYFWVELAGPVGERDQALQVLQALQLLHDIAPQFQDPQIQQGLNNIKAVYLYRLMQEGKITPLLQDPQIQQIFPLLQDPQMKKIIRYVRAVQAYLPPQKEKVPSRLSAAEAVGATILGALSAFVQPAVQQLQQGKVWDRKKKPSIQKKQPLRAYLVTDTSLIETIVNAAKEEGEIPSLTEGGIIKNTKKMINALVKFMKEYWGDIAKRINGDITAGRFHDPQLQRGIQQAIKEVDDAWKALQDAMSQRGWKEEYSYIAEREKEKIKEIKRELENLLGAWFRLLKAWKAAKPKKEALNIRALLFHPLGLPALRAALATLPPSASSSTTGRTQQKQETAAPQDKSEQPSPPAETPRKRLRYHPRKKGSGEKPGGTSEVRAALATLPASISFEGAATPEEVTQTGGPQKRRGGRGLGAQQREVKPGSGPPYPLSPGGKEATEKTLQEEITRAINFIKKRQVDDAIKAVANAITILHDIGNQKPQPQGAFPTHLREAASYLRVALQRLRDASQLDPDSDGFNDNLRQANSLLWEALKGLSNPTAGSTPYLGRNLLLLMKTLRSVPSTAQSHHQRTKNEDILEKETI